MDIRKKRKTAVCWSSGKDCSLALYRLMKDNEEIVCLVSMVSSKDERNHAHGIKLKILKYQAEALGLPLVLIDSEGNYEASLVAALKGLKAELGIEQVAFGSLYAEEDRKWNEEISHKAGVEPIFPAWISPEDTNELMQEFLSLGFTAYICRASSEHFDQTCPGRILDFQFYEEIRQKAICVMGEAGEYHTFVTDGPIFNKRIELLKSGVVMNSGLWSLDIQDCRLIAKNE